jgi:hypothetical protein
MFEWFCMIGDMHQIAGWFGVLKGSIMSVISEYLCLMKCIQTETCGKKVSLSSIKLPDANDQPNPINVDKNLQAEKKKEKTEIYALTLHCRLCIDAKFTLSTRDIPINPYP